MHWSPWCMQARGAAGPFTREGPLLEAFSRDFASDLRNNAARPMQAVRPRSSHARHAGEPSVEHPHVSLGVYSEEDDAATQMAAARVREARWIVLVDPLDRRIMSTEEVLSERQRSSCIHDGTLVWRGGMDNWSPLAAIEELALAAGRCQTAVHTPLGKRSSWGPARAVLASCAAALLGASLTTEVLRRVRAFDAPGDIQRSSEQPWPGEPEKNQLMNERVE